jgi:hypothetical protein
MKPCNQITGNEQGSVLLLAILILFAVTMLGIFSTSTSTVELKVSANNAFRKKAFYAAEAGLARLRYDLSTRFDKDDPFYTFALDGSQTGVDSDGSDLDIDAAGLNDEDPARPDFENGAVWYNEVSLGDARYTVTVYDDWEADDACPEVVAAGSSKNGEIDCNNRIYARSVGEAPGGGRAIIEALLGADIDEQIISGYTAQTGAGAVKQSESGDKAKSDEDDTIAVQGEV